MPRGVEPPRDALARMVAALGHRGPDDHGIEVVDGVGLAHTRLAIVDPSPEGHQPMRSVDGSWWITYNGEAFNHGELRTELGPRPWRGGSDTETVVEALATLGDDAVRRLNGLFAFAALDTTRRRLLLVRDRFGVKPLYVARHAGGVWFASEMRALLAAGVPREADPDVLTEAIERGWPNGRRTTLARVQRVLPGTWLEVSLDTHEITEHTWYDPADVVDGERVADAARRGRAALRDELLEALRASVRRRMMSDVPLGTMCSGGIDSGLITALAAEEDPGVGAYNAAMVDQPEHDEAQWAQLVAGHLGVTLHTVPVTARTWRAGFAKTAVHVEYPMLHPGSVPMAQIAGLAHSHGVKVLLSGEGADELFAGYGFKHVGARQVFEARRNPLRALVRRRRWRGHDPAGRAPEFDRSLAERAREAYAFHRGARAELEAGLLADLGTYLPHLLNRQDRSTMQESVETRIPFLDPDVVALALNLPLEARVEPAAKGILRELALERLPRAAVERGKRGFGVDADRYILPAARPEFLVDGVLREVLGVERDRWAQGVAEAKYHVALLAWSAEIWCRSALEDHPLERIEAELWNDVDAPVAPPHPALT